MTRAIINRVSSAVNPMLFRMFAIVLLVGLVACNGTETGNPSLTGDMQLQARSSDPEKVALALGSGVVVNEAWVAVSDVALGEGCDLGAGTASLFNPGAVDLLSPAPSAFDFEPSDYCRVVVPLDPMTGTLPPGAPAELLNRSVLLRGQRADSVVFEVLVDQSLVATVGGDVSIRLDETKMHLILGFDVARWLRDVDLDSMSPPADGSPIQIGGGHQADVLLVVEGAIEAGSELFHDADADGELDPEEETPLLSHHRP